MKPFSERDVTVTLTGAEWVALLARLVRYSLSPKGEKVYLSATTKLQKQLEAQGADGDP